MLLYFACAFVATWWPSFFSLFFVFFLILALRRRRLQRLHEEQERQQAIAQGGTASPAYYANQPNVQGMLARFYSYAND